MNESTFSSPPPLSGGNDLEQVWRKLANGPCRPLSLHCSSSKQSPEYLLFLPLPALTTMTWSKGSVNAAREFCLVELSISFSQIITPSRCPISFYCRPSVLAYLASDLGSKRIRRQSPGEDLGLHRFPKPHYSPIIGPVIGSARASPVVSSSEFCLGFFPAASKMLFPRCFLTSKGRCRVCPSPGASSKNKMWNSLGLKGGLESYGIC